MYCNLSNYISIIKKDLKKKFSICACSTLKMYHMDGTMTTFQSRPQSRVPFGQRHGTKALAMSNEIPVLIG